ncbi:hypothetical protein JCM16106_11460 [Hydrogenophilus islandicus]
MEGHFFAVEPFCELYPTLGVGEDVHGRERCCGLDAWGGGVTYMPPYPPQGIRCGGNRDAS